MAILTKSNTTILSHSAKLQVGFRRKTWLTCRTKSNNVKKSNYQTRLQWSKNRKMLLKIKAFLLPMTHEVTVYYLWHTRWRYITYDTRGDGKYQFSAICRIPNQLEFQRSLETLRRETVSYLEPNPVDAEGFLLDLCLEVPFSKYLDNMSNNGTYCDGNHRDGSSWTINIEFVLVPPLGRAQK